MSRDRDPYDRAVARLTRGLRAGAFGHGQPLHVHRLAADLAISSTPVREALARLAGEGLIERASTGYVTPRHDAASLADLYSLDEIYALAALSSKRRPLAAWPPTAEAPSLDSHVERTELALARLGMPESRAFWAARRNLWNRLAPFREAETSVLGDLDAELGRLRLEGGAAASAREVRAYYRRRVRTVSAILAAAQGRNIDQIYLEYVSP
ncbi:GntR family transcriptional regulator [Caulobacter sp. KR2-114]|uniref:GntR family transcriptional regulator n=1 Tax=Caulobacter sp. KR2-114 TaxID=3400912 RepID=UPI003C0EB6DF